MPINVGTYHETHISTQQEKTANHMWFSQENEDQRRSQDHQQAPTHRTQTPLRIGFPKSARLLKRPHFLQLIKQGQRLSGSEVRIEYRKTGRSPRPKLGITVSRRYGKAHERNRFKRIVREAFRQLSPTLPRYLELNISPKASYHPLTLQAILADLKKLITSNLSIKK